MIGLFNAPAVMRLPDCASTPVTSPVAVGHKFDFTSRVTCTEARASSRPTEICGLFFIASASACFKVRDNGAPGVCGVGVCGAGGYGAFAVGPELVCVGLDCGIGAGGKLAAVCTLMDIWAKLNRGIARNSRNDPMCLCVRFMD